MKRWIAATLLFAGGCSSAPTLERVIVDGDRLVLAESGTQFVALGFNYDHDTELRLLEEYWEDDWDAVVEDFDEMADLGANVVRIHLQVEAFMDGPTSMRAAPLDRLVQLADVAAERGIRLDVTGLAAYRGAADPAWYLALSEEERWAAQAVFWSGIAQRLAGHPAILAYDLMNEPVVPTEPATDWTPGDLAGLSYVQLLVLDLGGRDPATIAAAWRGQMVAAIRAHDPDVLITVGQLPFAAQPGFSPEEVAADLDYLSVHVYPSSDDLAASQTLVEAFAAAGRPVIVEETFPLECSADELEDFVLASRPDADGWIGFYWGTPPDELRPPADIPEAILLSWLDAFVRLREALLR